jgi:hypothetical protein
MLAKFDNLIGPTPLSSRAALLKQACLTPASEGLESDWQQLLFASQSPKSAVFAQSKK